MSLAYTAPTWEDGSGTGISASQLQALSDCMQGLVKGSDKAIHSIAFNNGIATITYADGSIESNVPANMKGISSIAKTGTVDLVDTYTVTYTDGTTFTYTVTNGRVGQDGRDGVIQYTAGTGITISDENVISADAQPQEQADWDQADNTKVDYIKNKPDMRLYYATDDNTINDIENTDLVPIHSTQTGNSGARQMLFSTIKSVLKTYFDGIYATLSSVTAKADITAIAYNEDGATCKNPNGYKVGEHFYRNGMFCTCTAPGGIAYGAQFTLGTNYVEGTVADCLPVSYSTTERFTGQYWTNGKPIYQKTIVDTLPNATTKKIDIGATVDEICDMNYLMSDSGKTHLFCLTDASWISSISAYTNSHSSPENRNKIGVVTLADFSTWKIIITIKYTKI